ncbi:hypothetical protein LPW26_14340 [Rhodopseudomonas sp. HC1]|uniref:hypothetical protein n=1 Tax=Rhodopseudomonas infernalis TaxID=2897386 RepID=UPI001EE91F74|nr:hypothetical protein [Rhodopseudomonas infernalis]MCG6205827.1 hypothetical protein [Rhodopseudomonas infernalis]
MASSGSLARSLACAIDLPEAIATTALKVLRQEEMVTKKGRGTSAAMMSAEDVATILIAIAGGAVPTQIVEVTSLLMNMPKVATHSEGPVKGFNRARAALSLFYSLPDRPTLRDALVGLIRETSDFFGEKEEFGPEGFDPTLDSSSLRFMLGMDARKLGGFAILRARVSLNTIATHYFSSWPQRSEFTSKGDIDPQNCFVIPAGFLSIASFDGRVFSAAIESFREPITTTRVRFRRLARP